MFLFTDGLPYGVRGRVRLLRSFAHFQLRCCGPCDLSRLRDGVRGAVRLPWGLALGVGNPQFAPASVESPSAVGRPPGVKPWAPLALSLWMSCAAPGAGAHPDPCGPPTPSAPTPVPPSAQAQKVIAEVETGAEESRRDSALTLLETPNLPNGVCPPLRVFADADDLCAHGILGQHAFGTCEPLLEAVNNDTETRLPHNEMKALGSDVQFFLKHYLGSGDSAQETVHAALRVDGGLLWLGRVVDYDSQSNGPPTEVQMQSSRSHLRITGIQELWWDEPSERAFEFECTRDSQGTLTCMGACPSGGAALAVPPIDCEQLNDVGWDSLATGSDMSDAYGGRFDEQQFDTARFTAERDGHATRVSSDTPAQVRSFESEVGSLVAIELVKDAWVLMNQQAVVLYSDQPFRLGRVHGQVYVVGWQDGVRTVHRVRLRRNELDAVAPGLCSF